MVEEALLNVIQRLMKAEEKPDWRKSLIISPIDHIEELYARLFQPPQKRGLGDDILETSSHKWNFPDESFYEDSRWRGVFDFLALGPSQIYRFFEMAIMGGKSNDKYDEWAENLTKEMPNVRMSMYQLEVDEISKLGNMIGIYDKIDQLPSGDFKDKVKGYFDDYHI